MESVRRAREDEEDFGPPAKVVPGKKLTTENLPDPKVTPKSGKPAGGEGRSYTNEFKRKVVAELDLAKWGEAAKIVEKYGLSYPNVCKWRRDFRKADGLPPKPHKQPEIPRSKRNRNHRRSPLEAPIPGDDAPCPPIATYTSTFEVFGGKHYMKFAPHLRLPEENYQKCRLDLGLKKVWHRAYYFTASATWPALRDYLAGVGVSFTDGGNGSVCLPNRGDLKAAEEALLRILPPGTKPDTEFVRDCAHETTKARGRYHKDTGFVRSCDVADEACKIVLERRRAAGAAVTHESQVNESHVSGEPSPPVPVAQPPEAQGARVEARGSGGAGKATAGPEPIPGTVEATLANFDISGFPEWSAKNLTIIDKGGKFVKLVLNKLQVKVFAFMLDQWRRTGMIRINIVKHRQWGASTLCQALFYYVVKHVHGVNSLVMAHRDDASNDVFLRTKLFEQYNPEKSDADLVKNNRKELAWSAPSHSAIRMAVADDKDFGHGGTRHLGHLTEVARWGPSGEDIMVGVLISIHDLRGTMVIRESVSNGRDGVFYRSYVEAKHGLGLYENIFIGFLEDPECRWEGAPPEHDSYWSSIPPEWTEDEPRLKSLGADWPALAFRRKRIGDKCKGQPAEYRTQFPATAEESFATGGSCVFPVSIVDPMIEKTQEQESKSPAPRFRLNDAKNGFVPDRDGLLTVWRKPAPGRPYVVGGDVGRGVSVSGDPNDATKLDWTVFYVLDEWDLNVVAVWRARMDPDLAAVEMAALGRWYGDKDRPALLCPESNHYGVILVNRLLKELAYPRVFKKETVDKGTRDPITQDNEVGHFMRHGWWSGPGSGVTKTVMISNLNQLIREKMITIPDPGFWDEARTFIRAADGSMDAERSRFDDRVMTMAIISCLIILHPKHEHPEVKKEAPKFLSERWYRERIAKKKAAKAGSGGGGYY